MALSDRVSVLDRVTEPAPTVSPGVLLRHRGGLHLALLLGHRSGCVAGTARGASGPDCHRAATGDIQVSSPPRYCLS